MAASVTFGQPTTVLTDIGGIQLDAVVREVHRFENILTENPVESGAELTDHIINRPLHYELEGIITDTPLGPENADVATTEPPGGDTITETDGSSTIPGRSKEAYKNLETLYRLRTTFDVVHGLGIYRNLIFVSLEFPREAGMGRRILVRAVLREILTARTISQESNDGNVDDSVNHSAPQPIDIGYQPTIGIV